MKNVVKIITSDEKKKRGFIIIWNTNRSPWFSPSQNGKCNVGTYTDIDPFRQCPRDIYSDPIDPNANLQFSIFLSMRTCKSSVRLLIAVYVVCCVCVSDVDIAVDPFSCPV